MLDGELVAWKDGAIQPFAALQQRIGRKKLTPAILAKRPRAFLAYDLLEEDQKTCVHCPCASGGRLEALLRDMPHPQSACRPWSHAASWDELAALRTESRSRSVEGLMLKALDSPYGTGRQRGSWWKWKIEPYTFDAVHALRATRPRPAFQPLHRLHLRRLGGRELVPVAKAYSGLSNAEISEVDRMDSRAYAGKVRSHSLGRAGARI